MCRPGVNVARDGDVDHEERPLRRVFIARSTSALRENSGGRAGRGDDDVGVGQGGVELGPVTRNGADLLREPLGGRSRAARNGNAVYALSAEVDPGELAHLARAENQHLQRDKSPKIFFASAIAA